MRDCVGTRNLSQGFTALMRAELRLSAEPRGSGVAREVWPAVPTWLEHEPKRTAKELFQRLQIERGGAFPNGQLRTLQRRRKAWRSGMARQLIFAAVELAATSSQEGSLIEN